MDLEKGVSGGAPAINGRGGVAQGDTVARALRKSTERQQVKTCYNLYMSEIQKAQSWQDCDTDIKEFVNELVAKVHSELGDNLVGIYLHGSLAMGGYYRPKSDIDVLIVVNDKLADSERKSFAQLVAKHAEARPTTGNVELSVILSATAKAIPVPIPFEVHYSSEWHDKILSDDIDYTKNKTDIDLQSHLTYVVQRGICLYGKPINEVFGDINWQIFMEGVLDDFNWIIEDENILETPFYGVLNMCRVLQLAQEDKHLAHSKDEGGEWALQNLPEQFHYTIQQALDAYHSPKQVDESQRRTNGETWDKEALLALRDFARSKYEL